MSSDSTNRKKGTHDWNGMRKKSSTTFRLIHGKYLCVLTGAGNSIGKEITNTIFQEDGILPGAMTGSKLILLDNDISDINFALNDKKMENLKQRKIPVDMYSVKAGDIGDFKLAMDKIISKNDKDFEMFVLINNFPRSPPVDEDAEETDPLNTSNGCLGGYIDYVPLRQHLDINLTIPIFATTGLCHGFCKTKRSIFNIVYPDEPNKTPFIGLPDIARNASDMFFEKYAKEYPIIKISNYDSQSFDRKNMTDLIQKCNENAESAGKI